MGMGARRWRAVKERTMFVCGEKRVRARMRKEEERRVEKGTLLKGDEARLHFNGFGEYVLVVTAVRILYLGIRCVFCISSGTYGSS